MDFIRCTEKTACAYIRVSTDKQDELSPDAQKRLLLEYAKKNNITLSDKYIFIENGISGKKADNRPAFMDMIGLAKSKEHPFDIILVWKFSRFARNQEESIVYKSLLKRNNVEVVSISEPLLDGPFGSLIERIIEWMDEYYSIRLSGEVLRGMTEKALRGGYQSSPPIGYKMNQETKIPYIIPDEAQMIQKIYYDYAYKGKSFLDIARDLNNLGYNTRRGGKFEQRTVKYILENPYYIGKIRWNRQDRNNHTIKEISEWIISDGSHEKIINEELFHLVQEQIKTNTRAFKSRNTNSLHHWLTGMVRCSCCGHTLIACKRGKTELSTYYFQCGAYNKGACNISHSIKASKLEESVIDAFERVLNTGEIKYSIKEEFNDEPAITLRLLELQYKKTFDKEHKVKQAYMDGIDSISEYQENKQILHQERSHLIEQIQKAKTQMENNRTNLIQDIHNIYEIIKDNNCDMNLRRNALRSVVSKIIYNKPKDTLEVYFYIDI